MDLSSPHLIWSNIVSTSRNKIYKAIKNDVKIYSGRYPEIFEKFREIYNATMDKNHADSYYYFGKDFYESVLNDLPHNSRIFYAVKDGLVMANKQMSYHLSGSLQEYNKFAPVNLLLYTAALWGFTRGYKSLYLGGGVGTSGDSLFRFKKSFYKGKLNHFYLGKKVYNTNVYDDLIVLRSDIDPKRSFFPVYRA